MIGLLESLGLFEIVVILVVLAVVVGAFVLGGRSARRTQSPPGRALPPSTVASAAQKGPQCRWCGSPLRSLADGRPAPVCATCGRDQ